MNNKCDAYHTCKRTKYLDPATVAYITGKYPENNGAIEEEYGYCSGTKEQEECSCGGDRTRCDFYPEVREKVESEDEGILYLKNVLDILYEYGKLTNYDVICEVSVIDTVIGKMKSGEWT